MKAGVSSSSSSQTISRYLLQPPSSHSLSVRSFPKKKPQGRKSERKNPVAETLSHDREVMGIYRNKNGIPFGKSSPVSGGGFCCCNWKEVKKKNWSKLFSLSRNCVIKRLFCQLFCSFSFPPAASASCRLPDNAIPRRMSFAAHRKNGIRQFLKVVEVWWRVIEPPVIFIQINWKKWHMK